MNAHYQTYSNLSSPHSPSPDESGCYTTLTSHTAGNSNAVNNGIGGIGGGGGSGGGGGVSGDGSGGNGTGANNNSIGSNGVIANSNKNCNIAHGSNSGLGNVSNTETTINNMNGHGNNTTNDNNNNLNGASGGCGSSSLLCNSNSIVHHHHLHQNGNHEQHMHSMDNDQPDFHHHFNNSNNNNSPIKSCAGCGGKILERYLLHALDRYWHNSCLKCYCCGALLADIGASCYTKAGMILCKSDYARMFATAPCSSCGQIIAANEFVMRTTIPISNNQNQNFHQQQQQQQNLQSRNQSNQQIPLLPENQKTFLGQNMEHHVFHLKCFTCSKCSSQLRPGDRYYMLAGSLVCEPDWHKLLKNTTQNPPIRKGKVGRPRRTRD